MPKTETMQNVNMDGESVQFLNLKILSKDVMKHTYYHWIINEIYPAFNLQTNYFCQMMHGRM